MQVVYMAVDVATRGDAVSLELRIIHDWGHNIIPLELEAAELAVQEAALAKNRRVMLTQQAAR
eukprot:7630626-Pyramimonas_sp.AAC.1